jgi:FkbM family methyltransferase
MIKKMLKYIVSLSPIALTKNEQYDRLTKKILQSVCKTDSVCVDVGANEGKVLKLMMKVAPVAKHFAFEPIPVLFKKLASKFNEAAHIYNIALSNSVGTSKFNLVLSDMAYSGLQKRAYDKPEKDTIIEVQTELLDNIISLDTKIALIKIDVEGAELLVLKGAIKTIAQSKPIILFEFGKAGSQAYNISCKQMFHFFSSEIKYEIFTLHGWLKKDNSLSETAFENYYNNDKEYFFVANPL